MKERPILFSAPMVRALLDGSKTQTRRIVKMKQSEWCKEYRSELWSPNEIAEWRFQDGRWFGLQGWYTLAYADCPYGQIGDRLWVRETWAFHNQAIGSVCDEDGPFVYAADPMSKQSRLCDKWTPSIHMPRWASRMNLEITGVRIERLNDISEDDAEAEGIEGMSSPTGGDDYQDYWRNYGVSEKQADGWPWFTGDRIASFKSLWESINDPGSWELNPWVWVIEFKQIN